MIFSKRNLLVLFIILHVSILFGQERMSLTQPVFNPAFAIHELHPLSSSKYQNRILYTWTKWYKHTLVTLVDENLNLLWSYQFPDSVSISAVKSDNNGAFWYGGYQILNDNNIGVFGKIDLNGQILFHKTIDPLLFGMYDVPSDVNWIHALPNGDVYLGTETGSLYRLDNLGNVVWSNNFYQNFMYDMGVVKYSANLTEDIILCAPFSEPFFDPGFYILRINSSGQLIQQDLYQSTTNNINISNVLLMDDHTVYLTCFDFDNYFYKFNNLGNWEFGYKLENTSWGVSPINTKIFSLSNGNFLYKLMGYHTNIILDPNFSIISQFSHNESTFDFGEIYSNDSIVQGVYTHSADIPGWFLTMYKYKADQQFACGSYDIQYSISSISNPTYQTSINTINQSSPFVPSNSSVTLSALSLSTNTVCALGENETELTEFTISPNPAIDFINLKFNEINKFDSFQIFNLKGEIVQEGSLSLSTNIALNAGLPNGLYFIKILGSSNQTASYRFIIQK